MNDYIIVNAAAIVSVLALIKSPLKRWANYIETMFHELGHAIIGILMGQKLKGFKLYSNTNGATITITNKHGLRTTLTQLSGYPAPIIFGVLGIISSYFNNEEVALWAMIIAASFMILFIRNAFGLIPLVMVIGLSLLGIYYSNQITQTFIILFISWLLLFRGTISIVQLWRFLPEGSDVHDLSIRVGFKERFWIIIIIILCFIYNYVLFLLFLL